MSSFVEILTAVAQDVSAARAELNQLDGIAGDGDLGLTMSTGARALIALAPELTGLDLASAVRRCGAELARKAPSTSGTLLATAFLRAAGAVGGYESSASLLARGLAASLTGMEQRGKASIGDKTMRWRLHRLPRSARLPQMPTCVPHCVQPPKPPGRVLPRRDPCARKSVAQAGWPIGPKAMKTPAPTWSL